MHAAPSALKKFALRMPRNPQSPRILSAINIPALKCGCRHFQKRGKPQNIVFGQINKTLLLTALRAAWLALELQFFVYPAGTAKSASGMLADEKFEESIVISINQSLAAGAPAAAA